MASSGEKYIDVAKIRCAHWISHHDMSVYFPEPSFLSLHNEGDDTYVHDTESLVCCLSPELRAPGMWVHNKYLLNKQMR